MANTIAEVRNISTECQECGGSGANIRIKFRYLKERIDICPDCWRELKSQIDPPLEEQERQAEKWKKDSQETRRRLEEIKARRSSQVS